MTHNLSLITYLVHDYDEAINWLQTRLGFALLEDRTLSPEKRWVRMAPALDSPTAFLIAKATSTAQKSALGKQAGDRVGFFLTTTEFETSYEKMLKMGVIFEETPRNETYGKVAVFRDLYGNRWDLLEQKPSLSP